MFHAFRPTGLGVEPYFPEGRAGRAAAKRLRRVFAAASAPTAYLIPRPRTVRPDALLHQTRTYLSRMRSLVPLAMEAAEVDADDPAIELLESPEIVIGSPSSEDTDEGRELLYVLAAWYGMGFGDPHTHDLREPLYGLACSYELANFVLAPLLDPADEYGDPFRAWFWLWRNGHSLRFDVRNRQCVITRGREVSDVGLDA